MDAVNISQRLVWMLSNITQVVPGVEMDGV